MLPNCSVGFCSSCVWWRLYGVPLLTYIRKLEPYGYIQWEDARFDSAVVKGDAALELRKMMRLMSGATKLNFE